MELWLNIQATALFCGRTFRKDCLPIGLPTDLSLLTVVSSTMSSDFPAMFVWAIARSSLTNKEGNEPGQLELAMV